MSICVVYPSGKLGDLIWHLPFFKHISSHTKQKVYLITRSSTRSKQLLKNETYIKDIFYNEFKKGTTNYFLEVLKIKNFFKQQKIKEVWILDKISRPAIAAKISGIKKIYGYGVGAQNFYITNKSRLSKKDLFLHYIERGVKFFKTINIPINYTPPSINIDQDLLKKTKNLFSGQTKKTIIVYGVDSVEMWKSWPQERYVELIKKINHQHKNIYNVLVASPKNIKYAEEILKNTNIKEANNLSYLLIEDVACLLRLADFYIGNDNGLLNLAAALNTKSIGIFGATRSLSHSELIYPVVSKTGEISTKTDRLLDSRGRVIKDKSLMLRVGVEDVLKKFNFLFEKK